MGTYVDTEDQVAVSVTQYYIAVYCLKCLGTNKKGRFINHSIVQYQPRQS